MTETVQPCETALTHNKKDESSDTYIDAVNKAKKDANNNVDLMISVCDSLYNLSSALGRLDHTLKLKDIENNIKQNNKEGNK